MPGIPVYIFPTGMGDAVMALAGAKNYRQQTGQPMHIGHKCQELFQGNPDVVCHPEYAFWSVGEEIQRQKPEERGFKLISLYYFAWRKVTSDYWCHYNANENLVVQMCQQAGLSGEIEINPHLALTSSELEFGKFAEGRIAVISSGVASYKSWPAEEMQKVIDAFPHESFLQLGMSSDPPLKNVEDCRGKYSLREIASVLSHCRLFLGPIGGMMHLARSVDCPSLVLLPSFETPEWYYREFDYITPPERCHECDRLMENPGHCPHSEQCLNIPANLVIAGLKEKLLKPRILLRHERRVISPMPVHGLELYDKMVSFLQNSVFIELTNKNNVVIGEKKLSLDNKDYFVSFKVSGKINGLTLNISRNFSWLYEVNDIRIETEQDKRRGKAEDVEYHVQGAVFLKKETHVFFMPWRSKARIVLSFSNEMVQAGQFVLHFSSIPIESVFPNKDCNRHFCLSSKLLLFLPKLSYNLEHLVGAFCQDSPVHAFKRCIGALGRLFHFRREFTTK